MSQNGVNVSENWMDIYPVRHKSEKNRPYNELSIKMLDRVISMGSNPGDVIFDPFGGSGTAYVVAELLGRKWIGSELGDCQIIADRFGRIRKDKDLLDKVYAEKNTLFPSEVKELRKKNEFWLSEGFDSDQKSRKQTILVLTSGLNGLLFRPFVFCHFFCVSRTASGSIAINVSRLFAGFCFNGILMGFYAPFFQKTG